MFASPLLKTQLFRPVMAQSLCVFLVLMLWIQIILFVITLRQIFHPAAMPIPPTQIITSPSMDNEMEWLRWPLFGEFVPKQSGSVVIKHSTLDLKIVGILFSTIPNESQVIVLSPGGIETLFKVGDILPHGVVIKRISANSILVSRDGELESLSLPKDQLIFEPPPKEGLFSKSSR